MYFINVQSPNLDLKQGISYLGRERGERDTEIDRKSEGGVKIERGRQKSNRDEELVKRYDKGNMHFREREGGREGERELRSKLGTATGNFFSPNRDGDRYG
jgi:hypothetical protein